MIKCMILIGGERTGDQKEGLNICISQFRNCNRPAQSRYTLSGPAECRKAPAALRRAAGLRAGPRFLSRLCVEPREQLRRHAALRRAASSSPEFLLFAAAELPETSQRPGKKRVQEGSAVSPLKRRKPAVQPTPKPAAPKARTKVKAPKRPKRERADSVEAVAVEAVEKERSSEDPWLMKRYYKVDVVSKVQWAYMKPEDILGAFAGISEFHQRRLGLRGVITRQYVPPNVPLCKEWLLSFDGGSERDCSATVQGERIVLTEEMFRDAFFIPEELNPGASSHPFPKSVMRSALEDWFSRYDEKAKRYLAEDCVHEEWRPVFQCLQSFLLAKRRPRSISGPIIHFVKSALEPVIDEEDGEEDTREIAHPKLLDLAGYQFKCVRDEMMQVKKHLEQPNNSRLRETFVDQVLTHLLIHLGIYKPSPEEDLNDDTQYILHEDVGSSKRRGAVRRKTLILAFDGLLVSIKSTATGLAAFLQACIGEFHLLIWTSRPKSVIDRIFRFLFKSKNISFDFAHDENCIVWSREQCFDLGKTSVPLYYKDFEMLYEHNISARDVLIVEDEVAKIGCNNLMNALVPKRWDLSVETPFSSFLIDHLLPFLTTWRSSVKGTVQFVEETRPWATLPWVEEPVEALMKWWGLGVKKTKTWTNILFRSCTYEERKGLRDMWTGLTVRQKARVESVERQKSHVESLARVESAVPIESDAPVESAARVAIDEPSAPISSVVDDASVPSTN
ncbi:hypothetical protein R1sor_025421 [Riccia sorocarpa]|uniref:FCP1 homology domain-containing protein n=1 Tax=Riccia sorocarpa TaxID=122646 RepID=A0ABD3G933_9MARC